MGGSVEKYVKNTFKRLSISTRNQHQCATSAAGVYLETTGADDFVILLKSRRSALRVMERITRYLEETLGCRWTGRTV